MDREQFIKKINELSLLIVEHSIKTKKFRIYCTAKTKQLIKDALCEKYSFSKDNCHDRFMLEHCYIELVDNHYLLLNDNEAKMEELPDNYKIH